MFLVGYVVACHGEHTHMGLNLRYVQRQKNKQYEVMDVLCDEVICFGAVSERISEIVRAMNAQYRKDNKKSVNGVARTSYGGMMGNKYNKPWKVVYYLEGDGEKVVEYIVDCKGNQVVTTDIGAYGPDVETAEHIVKCVNERKDD